MARSNVNPNKLFRKLASFQKSVSKPCGGIVALPQAENTIPRLQTMTSAAFPCPAGFVKSVAAGMGRTPGKTVASLHRR
jgi:hypothetical protein